MAREILEEFNRLDIETQERVILAWQPVIHTLLRTIASLDVEKVRPRSKQEYLLINAQFKDYFLTFYGDVTALLKRDLTHDMRNSLHDFYNRGSDLVMKPQRR